MVVIQDVLNRLNLMGLQLQDRAASHSAREMSTDRSNAGRDVFGGVLCASDMHVAFSFGQTEPKEKHNPQVCDRP